MDRKAQIAGLMGALDFDGLDRLFAEDERHHRAALDKVIAARIHTALRRGRVIDAEAMLARMSDQSEGAALIAKFKERYKDMPHGQWLGDKQL